MRSLIYTAGRVSGGILESIFLHFPFFPFFPFVLAPVVMDRFVLCPFCICILAYHLYYPFTIMYMFWSYFSTGLLSLAEYLQGIQSHNEETSQNAQTMHVTVTVYCNALKTMFFKLYCISFSVTLWTVDAWLYTLKMVGFLIFYNFFIDVSISVIFPNLVYMLTNCFQPEGTVSEMSVYQQNRYPIVVHFSELTTETSVNKG